MFVACGTLHRSGRAHVIKAMGGQAVSPLVGQESLGIVDVRPALEAWVQGSTPSRESLDADDVATTGLSKGGQQGSRHLGVQLGT